MLKQIFIACVACIGLGTTVLAQDTTSDMSDAEQIARQYMAFYSNVDIEGMETLLADTAVFADPTAMGPGIEGLDGLQFDGIEAAMEMLRGFRDSSGVIELGFVWDTVFESNNRVVFMGHVNALYPSQSDGMVFRWRAAQTTVITVRDGQVVNHLDFANYRTTDQGLIAQ
jgi:ketosteroid isomerase-like protein